MKDGNARLLGAIVGSGLITLLSYVIIATVNGGQSTVPNMWVAMALGGALGAAL